MSCGPLGRSSVGERASPAGNFARKSVEVTRSDFFAFGTMSKRVRRMRPESPSFRNP